ncbi:MAG: HAMP domain-containing sensor histidine kinase [Spirochaetota bacterium]
MKFFRANWAIIIAALLMPLVIVLAILQLGWIREMGERERSRLREGLFVSAGELATAFQRELLLAPWTLAPPSEPTAPTQGTKAGSSQRHSGIFRTALVSGSWDFFAERMGSWKNNSLDSTILVAIHLIEIVKGRPFTASTWDGSRFKAGTVETQEVIETALAPILGVEGDPGHRLGLFTHDSEEWDLVPVPREDGLFLLVRYDIDTLAQSVLPRLAALHLDAMSDYRFRIVTREDGKTIFSSDAGPADNAFKQPDLRLGLFRQDLVGPDMTPRNPSGYAPLQNAQVFLWNARSQRDSQAKGDDPGAPATAQGERRDPRGALWILEAVHRNGSLASVVQASMIRSALASSGILLLLGIAIIVLAIANRRTGALASRQEEFVASVTHELKTPLSVIGTAAANLSDGIVSDHAGVERYGKAIQSESRRLQGMIDRLLLYTRIGSSGIESTSRVDVRSLARAAVAERSEELAELRFRIEVSMPGEALPVSGDAESLALAIGNLVSNVIVHAAEGAYLGVLARKETAKGGRGGELVIVRITDQGPGIPRGERKAVFEAFYRGSRARSLQERGSGIGLNLAKRVVAAHGGSMRLESTEGHGTSVSIVLPLAPPVESPDAQA